MKPKFDMIMGRLRESDNSDGATQDLCQPITYSELKQLRDNAQLVPGKSYRITDYQCTTAQDDTRSAGHQFDIIVQALDGSRLSKHARAAHHAGDTYFADSDLEAWRLEYTLDEYGEWGFAGVRVRFTNSNPRNFHRLIPGTQTANPMPYTWNGEEKFMFVIGVIEYPEYTQYNGYVSAKSTVEAGDVLGQGYISMDGSGNVTSEGLKRTYTVSAVEDFGTAYRGTVTRMTDETGNDVCYDFKNIQFRVNRLATTNSDILPLAAGDHYAPVYADLAFINQEYLPKVSLVVDSDDQEEHWAYTFSAWNDGAAVDTSRQNHRVSIGLCGDQLPCCVLYGGHSRVSIADSRCVVSFNIGGTGDTRDVSISNSDGVILNPYCSECSVSGSQGVFIGFSQYVGYGNCLGVKVRDAWCVAVGYSCSDITCLGSAFVAPVSARVAVRDYACLFVPVQDFEASQPVVLAYRPVEPVALDSYTYDFRRLVLSETPGRAIIFIESSPTNGNNFSSWFYSSRNDFSPAELNTLRLPDDNTDLFLRAFGYGDGDMINQRVLFSMSFTEPNEYDGSSELAVMDFFDQQSVAHDGFAVFGRFVWHNLADYSGNDTDIVTVSSVTSIDWGDHSRCFVVSKMIYDAGDDQWVENYLKYDPDNHTLAYDTNDGNTPTEDDTAYVWKFRKIDPDDYGDPEYEITSLLDANIALSYDANNDLLLVDKTQTQEFANYKLLTV